jgi:hypothetical protein
MDSEHFPHAGAEKEYYWADIYFANYHINHDKLNWLKNFDVADAHRLVEDFDRFDAGDWTITTTEAGSGSASEAITDLPCGFLLVTTDDADGDSDEIVGNARSWLFALGYPCYAEFRGKVSDGLDTELWFGFLNGVSLFAGVTYGAYFFKPNGDRRLLFMTEYANTQTAYDTGWDVEDLTCGRLGIHWDGAGNVRWFIYADTDAPRICIATGTCTVDLPTNVMFYAGFGIQNGEAESKALYVDYEKFAMKRIPCHTFEALDQRDLYQ